MISSGMHVKALKAIVCLVATLLPLGMGYALFLGNAPHLGSVVGDADSIATSANSLLGFVRGFGAWSVPVFLVIQASQVVAGPVPAGPVIAAGSALFGFWEGLALSMVGIVVGSVCAFALGRRFGSPLLRRLVGEEALAKHRKSQKDSDGWWLLMVLLLPVPAGGDAACALAGLSSISLRRFVLVVTVGRLPGTALAASVGTGLVSDHAFVPVAAGLTALVVVGLTLRYRRRLKAWLVPSGRTGARPSPPQYPISWPN
jgi:uncharacterized membrane protein YdjX (TVP38/TMEM64 family)